MAHKEVPEFLRVPWGIRQVIIVVAAWFGLQIAMGLGVVALSRDVPAFSHFLRALDDGAIWASFTLNLAGILIGFALVAAYLRKYRVGLGAVGIRRVSVWKTLKYLVGILLSFVVLANVALQVIKLLVPGFDPNQAQTNEFTNAVGSDRNLALIALVLLPPIFEETIFRGFMFPAIAKRWGVVWGAVVSSAIFGLAHGQPNLFVYTMILGLLLCFMYRRLGSTIPGMLLHMANNYLAFLALSSK